MTYSHNSTLPQELVEQIAEQGFDYLPEMIRIMINVAMQPSGRSIWALNPMSATQNGGITPTAISRKR